MILSRSRTILGTAALLTLALSAPSSELSGQTLSLGAVFPLFGVDEFCESSTLGAFQLGYEAPLSGSIIGQVEGYYAPNGFYPWPWAPVGGSGAGGQQAPLSYDHDGGFRLAVNFLVPLTGGDEYETGLKLKALAGFGARRLGAANYSQGGEGEIERYGVDTQIAPLLTAGFVADIGITDRVGLRLQGRGNAIFSGDLQLRGATSEQDRILSSDTQVFAQATAGITVALGR